MIDTSNNIGMSGQTQEVYADRFIGPYARNQLNCQSWLGESTEGSDEGHS